MTVARIASELETDEDLVAAVRLGDDRAFELLYGRYHRRISSYARGMVNDHGRAEDITQEIFMSALRRMRKTEDPIAFKPWIYAIARNECIDQFRRSRRAEEVSFDDAGDGAGAVEAARIPSATPDAAIDAKQQLDDLCGAFGGLSDTHHQILVLRELEGLSYRQIGERLGLSRPSVESTLFRARRRLAEEYDELVSGERCRRVSAMLGSGTAALGARDERRLARHVAHCQPCRRQAYAAGVDTAMLSRSRSRQVATRVAALLPVPAFLRLRRPSGGSVSEHLARSSGTLSSFAEPAAGWAKAVAATAALAVAGGAGVVMHEGAPSVPSKTTPVTAPAPGHRGGSAVPAGEAGRGTRPAAGRRESRPSAPTGSRQARSDATSAPTIRRARHDAASPPAIRPAGTDPSSPADRPSPAADPPLIPQAAVGNAADAAVDSAKPTEPLRAPTEPLRAPTVTAPAVPDATGQAEDLPARTGANAGVMVTDEVDGLGSVG